MAATINSPGVQRAHMMNGIEEKRMRNYLRVLDKERKQVLRTTSQDIRMVGLTIDFIKASSGYSPEGIGTDERSSEVEEQDATSFMYGGRLPPQVRAGSRRVKSAPLVTRKRRDSESSNISVIVRTPNSQCNSAIQTIEATPYLQVGSGCSSAINGPGSRPHSSKKAHPFSGVVGFHQDDVRRLLPRPQSNEVCQGVRPPRAPPATAWGYTEEVGANRPPEGTPYATRPPSPEVASRIGSGRSRGSRAHQISRAVQQARALTVSARNMRNMTPSQALLMTNTLTSKQQETKGRLQDINDEHHRQLQKKLRQFYAKYPIKLTDVVK